MPTIFPFSFGEEELNLDDSISATCSITKGDRPLKIWWRFRNDHDSKIYNLSTSDNVIVSRNSEKVSILTIDAVKSKHRGNYTCFAQNRAGTVTHSSYLAING